MSRFDFDDHQNPYASPQELPPPESTTSTASLSAPLKYRSAETRAFVLTVAAAIALMFAMLNILVMIQLVCVMGPTLPQEGELKDMLGPWFMVTIVVDYGRIISHVVMFVALMAWTYRANQNARALTRENLDYTPTWAIVLWFIPIVTLFMPFWALSEIARASMTDSSTSDWRKASMPSFVLAFWILHLADLFGVRIVQVVYHELESTAQFLELATADGALSLVSIAKFLAIIYMVGTVTTAQEAFSERNLAESGA